GRLALRPTSVGHVGVPANERERRVDAAAAARRRDANRNGVVSAARQRLDSPGAGERKAERGRPNGDKPGQTYRYGLEHGPPLVSKRMNRTAHTLSSGTANGNRGRLASHRLSCEHPCRRL